ncbi:MAG: hypothetical protein ACFFCZ_16240 [Promethearchaeota archaeon]
MLHPPVFTLAQAPTWAQNYGGGEDDIARTLIQTTDGGYALAGWTGSYGAGYSDFWLVKTDSNGRMQWNRTYGGAEDDSAQALIQTTDGGYALAGETYSYGAGYSDFWLVKTDSNGRMQWNRTYGGEDYDFASDLIQTADGGYALAGLTIYDVGQADFWLVKTDSHGIMQWNRTYGREEFNAASALIQTADGGYALAGETTSNGTMPNSWLVKTDNNGRMQWNRTYGGEKRDAASALIQTPDGGYTLAGETYSYGAGSSDFWLVKTDSDGITQWIRTYGGAEDDSAQALIQTTDGGYALAGTTESYGAGSDDCWLVKTDNNGRMQWNQTYGGEDYDSAYALIQTPDGNYVLAGATTSYGAGYYDSWLVKMEEIIFPITSTGTEEIIFPITSTGTEEINSTNTEGMTFLISIFEYLVIAVIGSSVGLLTSRPVYRRYKKWRQKRATSKALREDVNHL